MRLTQFSLQNPPAVAAAGLIVAVDGPLAGSDAVVVRGGENLHDGAPVKIVDRRTAWRSGSLSSQSRLAR